jgi:undecaprenyl-diphosphatase
MKRIFTSCFGLGLVPGAPGTFASLLVLVIFAGLLYSGIPLNLLILIMACLTAAASVICVLFSPAIESLTGKKDPHEIVIDEFAGQALVYVLILLFTDSFAIKNHIWLFAVGGFAMFRLFDISKPWPIKKFEKLPAGIGILTDDLAAGIFAGFLTALAAALANPNITLHLSAVGSKLNIFTAVFLGLVQGFTEFLPVSSSGHLALFENLFGFDVENMLLFDLIVHTGTVISIFIVFRKSIAAFVKNIFLTAGNLKNPSAIYERNTGVRFLILAVVATIVTAIPGFMLKDYLEKARESLLTISIMWIITGILLTVTDFRKTKMSLRKFGVVSAVVIGLFQAVAIMPGISRSGATISAAILLGLRRRWALEFSFLLAIPAILGATAVELIKDFNKINPQNLSVIAALAGLLTAVIAGIAALKILIKFTRKASLKSFAFYCFILACLVLIYCLQ